MKYVCGITLIMFLGTFVFAAEEAPQSFTLDGRLYSDSTGTAPLLDPNVTLTFQILSNDETCILYEETRTAFNSTLSDGYFSLPVGSEVGNSRRSVGYTNTMSMVYSNSTVGMNGKKVSDGTSCTYSPTAGDQRFLRMLVTTSVGTPGTRVLTPNMALDSVPHAILAERAESLQGLGPTNFLQPNTTGSQVLSQSNLESIFTSSGFSALNSLLAGTSGLYTKVAANGTAVLPTASAPATPAAGQIWYDAGTIKYYDAASSTIRTLSTGTSTQVAAASGTAGAPSISFAGDADTGWYAPLANTLAAATGGTERVRIDASGNLGIATADPTFGTAYGANETVVGVTGKGDSTNSIGRFVLMNSRPTATNLDYAGALDFGSVSNPGTERRTASVTSTLSGAGGASGYGGDLRFMTKDDNGALTQKMILTPEGRLGIGNTAPTSTVQITKTDGTPLVNVENLDSTTAQYPGFVARNYKGTSVNTGFPKFQLINNRGSKASPDVLQAGDLVGLLEYWGSLNTSGGASRVGSVAVGAEQTFTGTSTPTYMSFATTNSGSNFSNEKMRINSSGNVGIGTTSPTAKLYVSDTTTTTGGSNFSTYTDYNISPTAAANGSFWGHKTQVTYTTPAAITGNVAGSEAAVSRYGTGDMLNAIGAVGVARNQAAGTITNATGISGYTKNVLGTTTVATGGSFNVQTTGGTTGTGYGVYIGSIQATTPYALYSTDSAATTYIAGSVGIGTSAPGRLLHVNGPIRVQPSALPSTPANGDIAIDSGDGNKLKYYNGAWQTIGSGGSSGTLTDVSNITNSAGDITLAPVTTTGKVVINSGTPSSSTTTGALVVTGGAGVSGNLNVGGVVSASDISSSNIFISQSGASVYPSAGITAYSNSGRPQVNFTRTRGTYLSQTAVNDSDETGLFQALAHNGTQTETSSGISFKVDNINATGAGNHPGGRVDFMVRGTTDTGQYGLTPAMTLRNTGRVGIGTTNPLMRAEVMGSNSMPNNTGTAAAGSLRISQSASNSVLDLGVGGSGNAWLQSTNSTNLSLSYPLVLNPNGGSVGIGATTPQQGTLYIEKPGLSSYGADVWLSNSAAATVGNKTRLTFSSDGSIDTVPNAGIENVMTSIGPNLSDLTFNIYDGTAYNEKMRVKSDGTVGIGTTAPLAPLHLSTPSGATGVIVDSYGTSTNPYFIGRAARGTASAPTATVNSDSLFFIGGRGATSSGFVANSSIGITGMAQENFNSTSQGAGLIFETTPVGSTAAAGRTERMRVSAGGVVGIGTTSPSGATKLEVGGQIRSVDGSTGAAKDNMTAAVNWSNGNNQSMSTSCTTTAFTNMMDGATYNLAVTDTNATQCVFSQAGLTFYYTPANGSRISGLITFYSFTRIGSNVYVAWSAMNP